MIKFLIATFVILLLNACTTKTAHISEYTLAPNIQVKELKKGSCSSKSIKVGQTYSSSLYKSLNMSYGEGAYKLDTFTRSQWATSLNRAVNAQIVNMLSASKLFKTVQISQSRASYNVLLETNIEDFMQYFSKDLKESFVKVKISMTLIDAKTSKIIATKVFVIKEQTQDLNAVSGVEALNKALAKLLEESALWLEDSCQ